MKFPIWLGLLAGMLAGAAAIAVAQVPVGVLGGSGNIQGGPALLAPNPPTVSACGTSPVVNGGSNSTAGLVTTGTGTPTACTVTFTAPFPNQAFCTFSLGITGPTAPYFSTGPTKTGFTITWTTGTSSVPINYVCFGD